MDSENNFILAAYSGDGKADELQKKDIKKLTHLNHFSANLKDGKIDPESVDGIEELKEVKKHHPELKTLISVGGWGVDGFSQASATEEGRKKLAHSIVDFMKKHDFSGIDLDWEYPGISGGGIASCPEDKYRFTYLLRELRKKLDNLEKKQGQHYLLTIAAGAYQNCADNMELGKITDKYLDFINLMTYDMGSSRKITGHHTNLYPPGFAPDDYCVDKAVEIYLQKGVDPQKIVIGGAFYGHSWTGVENNNHGLNQKAKTRGNTFHDFKEIADRYLDSDQFNRFWDDEAKAPYLFDGDMFISYDDQQSLKHKVKYVKEKNLGGIMFYIYHADKESYLLNSIYREFKD